MKKLILSLLIVFSAMAYSQGTIPIPSIIGLPAALAGKVDKVTGKSLVADTLSAKIQTHITNTANPHSTTKAQVGLGNVDNTSDVNKPVSTAMQTALNGKQPTGTYSTDIHANITALNAVQGVNHGDQTDITGNAGTATKLQTARTINGVAFDGTQNITVNAVDATSRVASSLLGAANGVATLDANGIILTTQLPSYIDDVLEYNNLAAFPGTGETGKIYVAKDTNKTYRWSGSVYVYITSGAVDAVNGYTGVVSLSKSDIGLSNVDNTSDANKPVSTAMQSALNGKQASGTYSTDIHSNITALNDVLGSNHGDETLTSIKTKLGAASSSNSGYLTNTDFSNFSGKQNALGFTPYNATNPSGYISGITSGMVTTALGYTPWYSSNHPTTVSGYGITDIPTYSGTNFIQNQFSSAQTANLWINGTGKFETTIALNRSSLTSATPLKYQTSGIDDWFIGQSPLGNSTKNLSYYSYGFGGIVLDLNQTTGAASFASSVSTTQLNASTNIGYGSGYSVYPRGTGISDWYLGKYLIDNAEVINNSIGASSDNRWRLGYTTGSTFVPTISLFAGGSAVFTSTVSAVNIVGQSELSGSYLNNYFELRRNTTSGGCRIQANRDGGYGGIGFKFMTTLDNAAEISGTYTTAMEISPIGDAKFNRQIQSSLSTGTAPISVNSTTMVNNLNSQYWAGHSYPAGTGSGQSVDKMAVGLYGAGDIVWANKYDIQSFLHSDLTSSYIPKWNSNNMVNSLLSDDTNSIIVHGAPSAAAATIFSSGQGSAKQYKLIGQIDGVSNTGFSLKDITNGVNCWYVTGNNDFIVPSNTQSDMDGPTINSGSIQTYGGISAVKNINSGGDINAYGNIASYGIITASGNKLDPIHQSQFTSDGSTSGNMVCSMPFQTGTYKKVIIHTNNLIGNATYTFPTGFVVNPTATYFTSWLTLTYTSSYIQVSSSTNAKGFIVIEGY